jgi:hypothetical protein
MDPGIKIAGEGIAAARLEGSTTCAGYGEKYSAFTARNGSDWIKWSEGS